MSSPVPTFRPVKRDSPGSLADEACLEHDARNQLTGIEGRLHTLRTSYDENLDRATQAAGPLFDDSSVLAGLPEAALQKAQHAAQALGQDGARLPVLEPAYSDAMAHLDDRGLRKQLFEARLTRASDRGPLAGQWDNAPVVMETLELRHARAQLLGFRNHAEFALRHSVFADPDDAERYLLDTHRDTKSNAQVELDALWAFAKEKGVPRGFSHWDLNYYARWSAQDELGLASTEATAHFPLDAVLNGLSVVGQRLLGMGVAALSAEEAQVPPAWRAFAVQAANGTSLGHFILATEPAMDNLPELRVERGTGSGPQIRVQAGFDTEHPLLGLEAVLALARAFGRALALLHFGDDSDENPELRHDHALSAWLCAGYFERICEAPKFLSLLSAHHKTAQPAPPALVEQLISARARHVHLRASMRLEMALFDLRIHRDYVPTQKDTQLRDQILDTLMQVRREQSVLPLPYWTRVANASPALFVEDEAAHLWEHIWADHAASELFDLAERGGFSDACLARIRQEIWRPDSPPLLRSLAALQGLNLDKTG